MACGVNFLSFSPRECHVRNREKTVALHRGHPAKQLLSIRPALTGTANGFMWISVSGQRTGRQWNENCAPFQIAGGDRSTRRGLAKTPGPSAGAALGSRRRKDPPIRKTERGEVYQDVHVSPMSSAVYRRDRGRFRVAHAPAHADSCQFPVLRTKQ